MEEERRVRREEQKRKKKKTSEDGGQKSPPPLVTELLSQLRFDWVDSINSSKTKNKKKKIWEFFFILFYFWVMNEKNNNNFKDRWHQFQEKFNFEGRKINFQKWSRRKGIIFQKKFSKSKFQTSNFQNWVSNFKGKKSFSKDCKNQSRFSF